MNMSCAQCGALHGEEHQPHCPRGVVPLGALTVMVEFPDGARAVPSHMADEIENREPGSPEFLVNTPKPMDGWKFIRLVSDPGHQGPIDWKAVRGA